MTTIFELLAGEQFCDVLTADELEHGMTDTRMLIDSCRAARDDELADLHTIWLDVLLDEWTDRTTWMPAAA